MDRRYLLNRKIEENTTILPLFRNKKGVHKLSHYSVSSEEKGEKVMKITQNLVTVFMNDPLRAFQIMMQLNNWF